MFPKSYILEKRLKSSYLPQKENDKVPPIVLIIVNILVLFLLNILKKNYLNSKLTICRNPIYQSLIIFERQNTSSNCSTLSCSITLLYYYSSRIRLSTFRPSFFYKILKLIYGIIYIIFFIFFFLSKWIKF